MSWTLLYSLIIHIIAITVFLGVVFAFYYIAGNKNINSVVKNTENLYKEKTENGTHLPGSHEETLPKYDHGAGNDESPEKANQRL